MATTSPPQKLAPRNIVKDNDLSTWDLAWRQNVTPWDAGDVQPSLKEAVESSEIEFPREGRALVPGCGSGYDVFYFASALGYESLGLDGSQTAVDVANKLREHQPASLSTKTEFRIEDFFQFKVSDEERFDIILDHTFFVAIPPSLRVSWGRQMAALVKPGGYLITLVYPIDEFIESGPPYFVRPEHYLEPLGNDFVKVLDKIPEESSPSHVGRERLVVWRRV
ncbi:uncharacterized protein LACBIDRAFT_299451 [Laccaria bicolor S238N-H82]|uniref:Predicted protein n=1 Tax=Laccaria bicolor (strain S238N-H82 / ATCC MYA-4686) TaxID=486041 RepID=B0DEQ8_LACBS|nr:uncharacterized protein LACBIDRAFT_299451 [Laccaria bicolor S238N-H82]EDR06982.1 predicted protein [Laccaria bicolor S238N-H82]|eukprot:XP_001882355.1 predicted protein [Laccaria bicolor S238N-H82]